jgi:hypothetical protein
VYYCPETVLWWGSSCGQPTSRVSNLCQVQLHVLAGNAMFRHHALAGLLPALLSRLRLYDNGSLTVHYHACVLPFGLQAPPLHF